MLFNWVTKHNASCYNILHLQVAKANFDNEQGSYSHTAFVCKIANKFQYNRYNIVSVTKGTSVSSKWGYVGVAS